MPPGGKRKNAGNKPLSLPTVKRQFEIFQVQDEFLKTVGSRKRSEWVRSAISEMKDIEYLSVYVCNRCHVDMDLKPNSCRIYFDSDVFCEPDHCFINGGSADWKKIKLTPKKRTTDR